MLNLWAGASIYTMFYIRAAYNLVHFRTWEKQKLAFQTWYGIFEQLVVQSGTTNASADCQRYINDTIREALDRFASDYIYDLLIYSNSMQQHEDHVKWIMECLLKAGLYLKPEKCEFHQETLIYLELIFSTQGISMDHDIEDTFRNWSREQKIANICLNNLFAVQQSLGFWNKYRSFIKGYLAVAEPLTPIGKHDVALESL